MTEPKVSSDVERVARLIENKAQIRTHVYDRDCDSEITNADQLAAEIITALNRISGGDEVTEAMREALEPFMALADRFENIEGGVVEVCEPDARNPSPNIEPFLTKHFRKARRALAMRRASQSEQG